MQTRNDFPRLSVTFELTARFPKHGGDSGELVGRYFSINQQCFCRTANAGPAHFRIQHNVTSDGRVRRRADIDMANAIKMGDDRNPAFLLDTLDQAFAAARYNNIDRVIHGQQHADRRPVAGGDQLHRSFGQSSRFQALMQALNQDVRGMEAFRPAPQDRCVT